MRRYAHVRDGAVVELASFDRPIAEVMHPSLTWVDVTAMPDVAEGWTYDGTRFAPSGPPAEALAAAARARRDALLAASDWTQLADSPAAGGARAAAWRTYRAALRDLPKQPGFPAAIAWPSAPGSA